MTKQATATGVDHWPNGKAKGSDPGAVYYSRKCEIPTYYRSATERVLVVADRRFVVRL
jgi:hypothetical protein